MHSELQIQLEEKNCWLSPEEPHSRLSKFSITNRKEEDLCADPSNIGTKQQQAVGAKA